MNIVRDIETLANFKRTTSAFIEKLHTSGVPMVLTVNGKAEVVVQDAAAYQELMDRLKEVERREIKEAILESIEDFKEGRYAGVKETFEELRRELKARTRKQPGSHI